MTDSARCWHCEQPVVTPFVAHTPEGDQPACCSGCAAAIETIHGLGLADYYQFRGNERPEPPDPADNKELALFQLPDIVAPFIQSDGESQRISLILDGIHCAACVWLVEHALAEHRGVTKATLNLATFRLDVSWDSSATTLFEIAQRIHQLGYLPRLPVRAAQEKDQATASRWLAIRLLVAGLGAMQSMMYATALYVGAFDGMEAIYRDFFRYAGLAIATPVVFFSGWPFLSAAARALKQKRVIMDVPVSLALLLGWGGSLLSTLVGGEHVYFESISMFVFFLLTSRWLEQHQRIRVSQRLNRLQETLPLAVTRLLEDNSTELVPARLVEPGDKLLLKQGDVSPVDAEVVAGEGDIEQAVLTGEAAPLAVSNGDSMAAGATLIQGQLTILATGRADESRVARIGQLVEQAQSQRNETHRRLELVAGRFIFAILILAVATLALHWNNGHWAAFEHMLAVLVVTCPCALALAAPLSIAAGIGRALDEGLLVARPDHFLDLPNVDQVIFDKTGTLTEGQFTLADTCELDSTLPLEKLKPIVAALEQQASHPVAKALAGLAEPADMTDLRHQRDGVTGSFEGSVWRIGAAEPEHASSEGATRLCLYRDQQAVLLLDMKDRIRDDAPALIDALKQPGRTVALLSGDAEHPVENLANELGITNWSARMTPEQKQAHISQLQASGQRVMMIGDGVNDAPALVEADASVAMADSASLARQAASAFLLRNRLSPVITLFALAARTRRTLRQNIGWALGYNALAVPFAMIGWIPPWLAAIGMSASSLIVTLNAGRLSRWKL